MTDTSAPHHEDVESLLGVYALDALEPDEAAAVEAHVAICPRCRAELDAHREMAAALGNTVVALPPDLWDRIAERVAEWSRDDADDSAVPVPFARAVEPPTLTSPAPASPAPPEGAGQPPPRFDRPRSAHPPSRHGRERSARSARHRSATALAGVAAVAALLAFLTVSLVQANHQLGSAQQSLSDQSGTAEVQAALTTPGHRLVSLRSPAGRPVAEVVIVPDGRGYFVSSTMPALPADQTYQLWAMFGDRPVSLGLMGSRPANIVFTVASGSPTQLAVTVEPAGGVARPDHGPVASGSLDA
jgi:anti-sigma-K factor RskA